MEAKEKMNAMGPPVAELPVADVERAQGEDEDEIEVRCWSNPLTVILEREGDYPSMSSLLAQISRARAAMARGRARRAALSSEVAA